MTATIPHIDPSHSGEAIAGALKLHGAVIVDDFLDTDQLARFNAELDPILAEADPGRRFINPAVEWFFGKIDSRASRAF